MAFERVVSCSNQLRSHSGPVLDQPVVRTRMPVTVDWWGDAVAGIRLVSSESARDTTR
ncbi:MULTISPECIES: hypothetical protein [Kribbella]|uniref:hypothetical protein n=1 Tax=Kribbella TaxID=182639 RepID=UPI0031E02A89